MTWPNFSGDVFKRYANSDGWGRVRIMRRKMLRQAREERQLRWMSGAVQMESDFSDSGMVTYLESVASSEIDGMTGSSSINLEQQ